VSEGLTVHLGEADLGMNLVDAIVIGGAGIDLEDLPAECVGLGGDTAAEALLGEAVCFAVGRSFKDDAKWCQMVPGETFLTFS